MTDLQKYIDPHDGRLYVSLNSDSDGALILGASRPRPKRVNDYREGAVIYVPTARLLAMIDTVDPGAMRAYLRERSDYLDSPDELPIAERRLCDAIPEADSPEDVDGNREPVITVTPEALDAAEQLGRYVAEIRDAFARGLAR